MMRKLWCIVIILLGWITYGHAQITVAARLDSTNILIGDQVRLRLEVTHTPELTIQSIDLSPLQQESKIDLIKSLPPDTVYNKEEVVLHQDVILTSFDSGYHFIPTIPILYAYQGQAGEIRSEQLALRVRTYPISATDSLALQPIKDIIEEPFSFWDIAPYLAAGIGAAILITLIVWLVRRKRKKEEPAPEPVDDRPAHVIALERLEALKAKKLWEGGQIKEFHTELTYILRAYLEKRFDIRALESTTFQIMLGIKLQPTYIIKESWYPDLERLLQTADLVKFAKAEPPSEWHEEMYNLTKKFIVETKEEEVVEESTTQNSENNK